jgi:hypothetical protein
LKQRVADKPLIGNWLKADIKEEVKLIKASTGTNLGCVISPSLADIPALLNRFLDWAHYTI